MILSAVSIAGIRRFVCETHIPHPLITVQSIFPLAIIDSII